MVSKSETKSNGKQAQSVIGVLRNTFFRLHTRWSKSLFLGCTHGGVKVTYCKCLCSFGCCLCFVSCFDKLLHGLFYYYRAEGFFVIDF